MRRVLVALAAAAFAAPVALADTPTFSELFEDQGRVQRVPVTFPADIGTVFVSADESSIDDDVSCDPLSNLALYVASDIDRPPFEVRFLHDEPDMGPDHHVGERETFTLKLGVEEVTRYGATVGYESAGGFRFTPIQFGPASHGLPDADRFGEIYVQGEPTGLRYGNIFDSVCSGPNRMDAQVLVTFEMLGEDAQYFITIQSNAPVPQRATFGPYAIPDPVLDEGYGACMVFGRSGTGRVMADGATCLAASPHELLPINDDSSTHRQTARRTR